MRVHQIAATVAAVACLAAPAGAAHAASTYATYHINYLYLTPSKVSAMAALDTYTAADHGKKYVTVFFRAVNKDDVQQEVSSADLKLVIPSGEVVDTDFLAPTPSLSGKVLTVGGSTGGYLAWQVPVGTHHASISWQPTAAMYGVSWPTYQWKITF